MKIVLIVLGMLAAIFTVVCCLGYLTPVSHEVVRSVQLPVPPEHVYALIRDVERATSFRPSVSEVRILSKEPAVTYVESGKYGQMTLRINKDVPAREIVIEVIDEKLPFWGIWTFRITKTNEGSTLSITEQGTVKNPLFRFMSRYIFGYEKTVNQYLADIEKYFQKSVVRSQ